MSFAIDCLMGFQQKDVLHFQISGSFMKVFKRFFLRTFAEINTYWIFKGFFFFFLKKIDVEHIAL